MADTASKTSAQAELLRQSFEVLPAARRSEPNALLRALLSKLPSDNSSKQTDELTCELVKAETLKQKPPWSIVS